LSGWNIGFLPLGTNFHLFLMKRSREAEENEFRMETAEEEDEEQEGNRSVLFASQNRVICSSASKLKNEDRFDGDFPESVVNNNSTDGKEFVLKEYMNVLLFIENEHNENQQPKKRKYKGNASSSSTAMCYTPLPITTSRVCDQRVPSVVPAFTSSNHTEAFKTVYGKATRQQYGKWLREPIWFLFFDEYRFPLSRGWITKQINSYQKLPSQEEQPIPQWVTTLLHDQHAKTSWTEFLSSYTASKSDRIHQRDVMLVVVPDPRMSSIENVQFSSENSSHQPKMLQKSWEFLDCLLKWTNNNRIPRNKDNEIRNITGPEVKREGSFRDVPGFNQEIRPFVLKVVVLAALHVKFNYSKYQKGSGSDLHFLPPCWQCHEKAIVGMVEESFDFFSDLVLEAWIYIYEKIERDQIIKGAKALYLARMIRVILSDNRQRVPYHHHSLNCALFWIPVLMKMGVLEHSSFSVVYSHWKRTESLEEATTTQYEDFLALQLMLYTDSRIPLCLRQKTVYGKLYRMITVWQMGKAFDPPYSWVPDAVRTTEQNTARFYYVSCRE
jgi:hypothetical protein